MPEQKANEGKRKVKHDQAVSSAEVQKAKKQFSEGPYQVQETVVPSQLVSDVKKGLVKTTDVQQTLRKLKLLESKKKEET